MPFLLDVSEGCFHQLFDGYRIGREMGDLLLASEPSIEPLHCVFVELEGRWQVRDLAGTGRIWVDGSKVAATGFQDIQPGCTLKVGNRVFQFTQSNSYADTRQLFRLQMPQKSELTVPAISMQAAPPPFRTFNGSVPKAGPRIEVRGVSVGKAPVGSLKAFWCVLGIGIALVALPKVARALSSPPSALHEMASK